MSIELNAASEATVGPIRESLKAAEKIRALRFPDSETSPPSSVVPDLASRQGKVLGFNLTTGAPEAVELPTAFSEILLGGDTTGDVYYRSAGGDTARLPIGTTGQTLTVAAGLPAWATPPAGWDAAATETLTNKTLGAGTKVTLGADATGDIYYRAAGGALTRIAPGTNGHVLTLTAGLPGWAAAPTSWSASATETLTNKTLSTGTVITAAVVTLGSDATGDIYYRNSGGNLTRLAAGTNGHVLTLTAGLPGWAAAPVSWSASATETLTNKTLSTGTVISAAAMTLGSDATGDIYYRAAGGALTRLAPGSDGQVLTLASGLPSWAAASGAGLVHWTEAVNTAAPNATVPVVSFAATNAATNVDAALVPKGTGAIVAAVPDNTATGGNKRGTNAVDLQTSRSNNGQVASGTQSVIVGGATNTANGTQAAVVGGTSNTASGTASAIIGGTGHTAGGAYTFVCGRANTSNGDYSTCVGGWANSTSTAQYAAVLGGPSNTASGNNSAVIGGDTCTADGVHSMVTGQQAIARGLRGAVVRSTGRFSANGDCQTMDFILRRSTTDATTAVLSADGAAPGATTRIVLPTASIYRFRGMLVGRTSAGVNKTVAFSGAIKQDANAASTALIGSVTYDTIEDAGASGWTVAVVADTTNGALNIEVTGAAATTIRWAATVETIAIKY